MKVVKRLRCKAARLAQALPPALVQIDEHVPRCAQVFGRFDAVPRDAVRFQHAPLQLPQLFAVRLRNAGQVIVPACRQVEHPARIRRLASKHRNRELRVLQMSFSIASVVGIDAVQIEPIPVVVFRVRATATCRGYLLRIVRAANRATSDRCRPRRFPTSAARCLESRCDRGTTARCQTSFRVPSLSRSSASA